MPPTKWKQPFFDEVAPISLYDPLASLLGAVEEGEPLSYSYHDCVKLAGHACASVSSAFQLTRMGLKELYGDETPVRGEIEVRFAGNRESGANGPMGQVISFITGAATETGFHGLGGKFDRANLFVYDEGMESAGRLTVRFRRVDTGATVTVYADPTLIPFTDDEEADAQWMPKVVHGTASEEEREAFFRYWQGRNRKILLENHPEAFRVERTT